MPAFGDYQFEIYLKGLAGVKPKLPVDFASLEKRAEAGDAGRSSGAMSPAAAATSTRRPATRSPSANGA